MKRDPDKRKKMHIEELLERLTVEFQLAATPQKNREGNYELNLTPHDQLRITELAPGLFFSATLLPFPQEGNGEVLWIHLMGANFLGQGTGRGVIGIDQTEKNILFSLTIPYEMNYPLFKEAVEEFCNYRHYWSEEITKLLHSFRSKI